MTDEQQEKAENRVFNLPRSGAKAILTEGGPYFEVDNLGNLSLWESKETRTLWLPQNTAIQLTAWLNQNYPERQHSSPGPSR